MLPTARHRRNISSKEIVSPRRNDAEMRPANSLHASAYHSEYSGRFDFNIWRNQKLSLKLTNKVVKGRGVWWLSLVLLLQKTWSSKYNKRKLWKGDCYHLQHFQSSEDNAQNWSQSRPMLKRTNKISPRAKLTLKPSIFILYCDNKTSTKRTNF